MSNSKKRKISRKGLIKKLDTIFSKFIRLDNYDVEGGYVECYTCGTKKESIKNIHNGHFISRRFYPTRWDEGNCKPQCCNCNTYSQGQQYLFSLHLGAEQSLEMYKQSQIKHRPTDEELLEMIDVYDSKLNKLIIDKFKGEIP